MLPSVTVSRGSEPTLAATKRLMPKGGVIKPIAKFTTMMIPKCTGLIPMEVATGKRIGASTMIAGVVSMKQPTNNNNTLINNKIKIALSVVLIIAFVIMLGIC